jgi:hypothetical protein
MNILHAFWQPDETDAFARGGCFRLWAETDETAPAAAVASATAQPPHPFGLARGRWPALLESLGLEGPQPSLDHRLAPSTVRLPSTEQAPLPSPLLARRLGDAATGPGRERGLELRPWRIERPARTCSSGTGSPSS